MAEAYFRAGADKVSIGSDAVDVARKYRASGKADGSSSIEAISHVYGRQAVVVSIDPRRVWVRKVDGDELPFKYLVWFCWRARLRRDLVFIDDE